MRSEQDLKHALDIAERCAWRMGMDGAIEALKWALEMTDKTPWDERDMMMSEEEEATPVQAEKEPLAKDKPCLMGNAWWRKR